MTYWDYNAPIKDRMVDLSKHKPIKAFKYLYLDKQGVFRSPTYAAEWVDYCLHTNTIQANGSGEGIYCYKYLKDAKHAGDIIVELELSGRVLEFAESHRSAAGYKATDAKIVCVRALSSGVADDSYFSLTDFLYELTDKKTTVAEVLKTFNSEDDYLIDLSFWKSIVESGIVVHNDILNLCSKDFASALNRAIDKEMKKVVATIKLNKDIPIDLIIADHLGVEYDIEFTQVRNYMAAFNLYKQHVNKFLREEKKKAAAKATKGDVK